MSEADPAPATTPKLKLLLKISLLVGFLLLLNFGGGLVVEQINFQLWPDFWGGCICARPGIWFSN